MAAERRLVESGGGANAPVLVRGLRKVYGGGAGKKVALSRLSLHISQGECFGLLGPNGAGKSTTVSILTGLTTPTGGGGTLLGFDIRSQMHSVYSAMGVCPQAPP